MIKNKLFFLVLFCSALMTFVPAHAQNQKLPAVTQYETCYSAKQSAACLIAFEKVQTIVNPLTKKRFFHNGVHITEKNTIFLFPMLYVATPDIDQDGNPEIIVGIPEASDEMIGEFCFENRQCPHFIIQDRTLPDQERTVNTYKALGPIYAYSIALSTDEVVDNYRSLRVYADPEWKRFNVYQYDKKSDSYFNMSTTP